MRVFLGCLLIRFGMAIVPAAERQLARKIMLYHVPGVLSDDEKADVREAKRQWERTG